MDGHRSGACAVPAAPQPTTRSTGAGASGAKPDANDSAARVFTGHTDLESIRRHLDLRQESQSSVRPYHTPGLVMLDFIKYAGRLAEILDHSGLLSETAARGAAIPDAKKARLCATLADCCMASVRMADVCAIDLGAAIQEKLQPNEANRPIDNDRTDKAEADNGSKSGPGKRKRFTDEQLKALTELAEASNWSMMSVPKAERDAFCKEHCITKDRLHNFFNNRKPKDRKKLRSGKGDDDAEDEENENGV